MLSLGLGRFLEEDGAYRNPVVAAGRLLSSREADTVTFRPANVPVQPDRLRAGIRALLPDLPAEAFVSSAYPLVHREPARSRAAPSLPPGLRPNVVFVLMEGVRSHEVGAFGGSVPGLTPNLDRLANAGIRVAGTTGPGTSTPEGEMAAWYGLLPTPGSLVLTDHPDAALSGLPEALRRAGWRSFLWIHGGEQAFYRRDRFYVARRFRVLDGNHFDPDSPRTNWGISDRTLTRSALEVLDGLPEPFAAMVLTVSNHHPFQLPVDAGEAFSFAGPGERGFLRVPGLPELLGNHTVPMLRTVHYTDEAVGDFFEGAKRRDWFERTLFVVTSDHGIPIVPVEGIPSRHRFLQLRHGVPLVFFASFLPGGRTVEGPASSADIPATVLGLLGLPGPRAGTGRDLLAGSPAAGAPERPTIDWSPSARTVTVHERRLVYHGTVPEDSPAGAAALGEELLVDAVADPEGAENLAAKEPDALDRMRRIARAYLDLYPWIVASGRSGLPPSPAGPPGS